MSDEMITGTLAGTGSFRCETCGYAVSLAAEDALPACPSCGGETWRRASLFTTTHLDPVAHGSDDPEWLAEARASVSEPGLYLAYRDGDELVVHALDREWTRVGRSLAADIRFDDPTVSRRHALIVHQADGVRVLDDRSLNGVFVNGERVEWSPVKDGDEILVGRHELRFLDLSTLPAASAPLGGALAEPA